MEWGLTALPDDAARATGRALGSFVRSPLGLRRDVVETQLAASFPQRGEAWVRETSRACYRHFGEELAVIAGGRSRVERALDAVDDPYPARDVLHAAISSERGAVLVTGHLGNWELAGAYLARLGFPVTAVIQPQRGPGGAWLERLHRRLGFDIAYRDASPRRLLRDLRAGRSLALVADQHARRGGARLDFFGRPAWTTLGPARLSRATGAPLFFAGLVREGAGYRAILERVDPDPAMDEAPEVALTRGWISALEAAIRACPSQYLWSHRRWKGEEVAGVPRNDGPRPDVVEPSTESEATA